MPIHVGQDTLFDDRHGKWFVRIRQGRGASAREVVIAIERLERILAALAADGELPDEREP